MLRSPAVAGYFYQGSSEALRKQVEGFIVPGAKRKRAIGIVSPHAGLIYSGPVAGALYSSIEIPDTVVLIGPNHTGLGAAVSLMAKGSWETPLGTVEINETLAASILAKSSHIRDDSVAHLREHSLEVQLPFIQYFKEKFTIVPIQMLDTRLATCIEVGRAVGAAIWEGSQESGVRSQETRNKKIGAPNSELRTQYDVLIVASSDMSHYEPAA
ncbi:MAG: AmmeMemoRadiSam system protein B, partial [Nitrospiraceae bacterium]|nr:AmmeMemoRadiSam system protein B [Nitrospiraceae bacterium]